MDSLQVQMRNILDDYDKEVQDTANDVMETVSRESVQQLKSKSPKGRKGYARGWTRKKTKSLGIVTIIVHNTKFAFHFTNRTNRRYIPVCFGKNQNILAKLNICWRN